MTTTILVLARTLHIGSAMMLVALPFFVLVILDPALADDHREEYSGFYKNIIWGIWWALILEAFSGVVWFWFVTAQMSDQSPWSVLDLADLGTVLWKTQFGQLWVERGAVGVVLGVALYFVPRKDLVQPTKSSLLHWLVMATAVGLLVTLAWAGHAASGIHYHLLHLLADMLHLLIGAIWPMGLIPMGLFLSYIGQIIPVDPTIKTLQRFSQISLLSVFILIVTGIINGWLMVGSWEALVITTYGRLLLVKVLVVGIMIGLGAFNRLYLMPRMRAAPNVVCTLRRTIVAESFLALAVLSIVGSMGMTSPPN